MSPNLDQKHNIKDQFIVLFVPKFYVYSLDAIQYVSPALCQQAVCIFVK